MECKGLERGLFYGDRVGRQRQHLHLLAFLTTNGKEEGTGGASVEGWYKPLSRAAMQPSRTDTQQVNRTSARYRRHKVPGLMAEVSQHLASSQEAEAMQGIARSDGLADSDIGNFVRHLDQVLIGVIEIN